MSQRCQNCPLIRTVSAWWVSACAHARSQRLTKHTCTSLHIFIYRVFYNIAHVAPMCVHALLLFVCANYMFYAYFSYKNIVHYESVHILSLRCAPLCDVNRSSRQKKCPHSRSHLRCSPISPHNEHMCFKVRARLLNDRNNWPCPVCSMTLSQTEKGYPPAIEHVRVPQTILSEKGEYWVLVYILINF